MTKQEIARATIQRNIEARTGRAAGDWVKLLRRSGLAKHGAMVAWLKSEHQLTHGYANFLALAAQVTTAPGSGEADAVASQYGGAKSRLRPIYDEIVQLVRSFGPDVEIAPKRANVSLRRTTQFALLQPSTATRLDVGLILRGQKATRRLESSGSFNAMFTHRVRISTSEDIDAEFKRWLRRAYDGAV